VAGFGTAQDKGRIGDARGAEGLFALGQAFAGAGDEGQQLVGGGAVAPALQPGIQGLAQRGFGSGYWPSS
jgi:hypothetical protein